MTRVLQMIASATAAFAIATTFAADDGLFRGEGTTYTLGEVGAGNCNMMAANTDAATNYAALNDVQWNGLKNCGRCARVWCDDDRCADRATSVDVQILDRCPECKHGDLDLSPSVFKTLTHSDPSRYKIKWKFVDCTVRGNVKYCLKGGSNNFWTAIQPANTVAGVSGMQVNGKPTTMVDSAYYYLLNGNSQTQTDLSKVEVTLTSVSGETITDTVSLVAGSCTTGKLQFGGGGSQSNMNVASEATTAPPVVLVLPVTSASTTAPSPTPSPAPSTRPPTPPPATAAVVSEPTSVSAPAAPSAAPTIPPTTTSTQDTSTLVPVSAASSTPSTVSEGVNSPALDLSVAPTSSPQPTPTPITPEPSAVATAAPAPSSQSDNSISVANSSESESAAQKTAVGVPISLIPTSASPSVTSSDESQLVDGESTSAPAPASTAGLPVQEVQNVNTRNSAANGTTSPLILILSACGAVGVMVLIVLAAVVHRRKIREKKQLDDEPAVLSSVLTRSYDLLSPGSGKAADIAVL